MNLKRLEYFITTAETGSLRQASEILHVSPPALSKAMRVLEEELETKLWLADGRRIILTDSGKALLKKAPSILQSMRCLKDSLQNKSDAPQAVRLGSFEVFSTYFLTFLDRLKWDKHSLELHELLPGEVEKYILNGEIDIGITYLPVPHPELDFLKVTQAEMGVFHKKGSFKGMAQEDLPFVVPVMPLQGTPTRVRGLDGWPDEAFQRKVLHRVTLMESALELCRQGRVAGFFPLFVVEEHNRRMCDKYQLTRHRNAKSHCPVHYADVFIVKRKSFEENQIVKQLAKALRQIC